MIKVSTLKKNKNNPREIRGEKFELLKKSITEFPEMMSLRPMVIDANRTVLGGNMRLSAIKALGMKEIPDDWIISADSLTDAQKKEFVIKDNNSFGQYDWELLNTGDWTDLPLVDWGLDIPNFEAIEDEGELKDSDVQIDKAEELNKKWQVEKGDLYAARNSFLLCGDSTKSEDVARVLNGAKPNLMITDPPYGVDYDANWRNEADRANGKPYGASAIGKVENDSESDWTPAWQLFEGNVAYIWHAGRHAMTVQASLEIAGFEMRSQIIWAKNNFAISRGHYHWKHEPCWYAVRKGNNASWIGDHSQTSLWEIDKPMKSETGHSTQKPLECMARPIRNHEGDVYEPFAGSGTTLVACENLNRKCYAIEISENYCAVILERMSNAFPNLEIKRIEVGREAVNG